MEDFQTAGSGECRDPCGRGHIQPVDARGGWVLFILLFFFHTLSEFMQKPSPALFWFPVLPKPFGCCKVSTLRSGWWKAEMQRGAGRKSPTIPAGRGKKGVLVTGLARNTSAIVLMPLVVHRSLSYGWGEVGREGSGGLAHQFTWPYEMSSCGLVEQIQCKAMRMGERKGP